MRLQAKTCLYVIDDESLVPAEVPLLQVVIEQRLLAKASSHDLRSLASTDQRARDDDVDTASGKCIGSVMRLRLPVTEKEEVASRDRHEPCSETLTARSEALYALPGPDCNGGGGATSRSEPIGAMADRRAAR